MEKVDKGGCFATGPLTSQGLLHTMAALGLIPIKFANCGEVVKVPNFLANIEKNNHCQNYLESLALSLNISLAEAEQVTCKFGRILTGSEGRYQDAIYAGQCLYSILPNDMLRVLDGKEERLIKAPFLGTRTRSVAETKRLNGIQIGTIIWMRIPG